MRLFIRINLACAIWAAVCPCVILFYFILWAITR